MNSVSRFLLIAFSATACMLAMDGPEPSGLPRIAAPLTEGEWTWVGRLTMGERTIDMVTTVGVKATDDHWVIRHVVAAPGRPDAIDIATLDRKTMECIKREAKQGPLTVDLNTRSGKVTGTIRVGDRVQTVEADAGGPLFADGVAARQSIAALPIAEGYGVKYRTFDIQRMKPKWIELKVAGTEQINIAAGSFEAFRLEAHALDGSPEAMTLWMDKGSRRLVKMEATVGQASVSAELKNGGVSGRDATSSK